MTIATASVLFVVGCGSAGFPAPATVSTGPPSATAAPSPSDLPTNNPGWVRLERGDKGPAVERLQERLSALGYWLGSVDGRFGDATQQAVYVVQKVAGISRDGVVGRKTWR